MVCLQLFLTGASDRVLNKLLVRGRVTSDSGVLYTAKGPGIVKFTVAINRRGQTPEDEQREALCFVSSKACGRTGEPVMEYLDRGDFVGSESRLRGSGPRAGFRACFSEEEVSCQLLTPCA